ncbi:hypothetical protein OS493_028883 [Desmophyllum pertusum]|uniref:Uncharacterized protein n=1 Tax=Desmophyllum pertusum TaxID=174260 RepID=A0A9W9ZL61_9CNID|nr:hypothetical protein OS493_028883 [Desmophyllum pertusum]
MRFYKLLDNVVKSRAGHKSSTTSSHESLRKTQSIPIATASASKDIPHDGYDQLTSTPASSSASDHPLLPGMTNSLKNTYSAPYGHLPPRDLTRTGQGVHQVMPGRRSSVESEEGAQYNTLKHPGSGEHGLQQGHKGVDVDGIESIMSFIMAPNLEQPQNCKQQGTEDVYNVIGETLHPVLPAGIQANEDVYNTLSTSSASEQTYNTLDHGSPVIPPRKAFQHPGNSDSQGSFSRPPKATARKSEPVDKLKTFLSSSKVEGDDMYNTLNKAIPPPPPVRKTPDHFTMLQKSQSVDEGSEMYNTLDTSKARPPAPIRKTSEQLRKLQKSQSLSVDESADMYNTLDSSKVSHPPIQARKIHDHLNKQQTSADSDEMYNTLDVTRVGTPPIPARRKSASSINEDDDMYNTLCTTNVGPTLHNEGMDNQMPRNDDDIPSKRDSPELKRNSTSSLQSVRCPLDVSSQAKTHQHASSLDDLDSYASIDYATLSPPKGGLKQPPIPVQRSGPSKARKTSVPDVLSLAGHSTGKKLGKSGLVLNLKASLEAGGLDLTKLPRKPKKLSREGSEDLPTYAEVNDRSTNQSALADDVFVPGGTSPRPGRSQSSPSEPKPGEDIYDELDQAPRPKSLQITKAKKILRNNYLIIAYCQMGSL